MFVEGVVSKYIKKKGLDISGHYSKVVVIL